MPRLFMNVFLRPMPFTPCRSAIALCCALGLQAAAPAVEPDPSLPRYEVVSGVSGNLNSIGSDTLNNLLTLWAEGFKAKYPNVNIQVEGKGSATAPPALIEGTAQLGPMSRPMKGEEIDAFEKKFGYKPLEVKVAIDALAVFVHKDNPLQGLTLEKVDGMFSSTFTRGGTNISDWAQAGLDAWKGRAVSLYGRNSASGTYGFFKEMALAKGDFKSSVKEQPGSSAVIQGVSADLYAIGFAGIGYATSGVKSLALGESEDALAAATYENCLDGSYPLARFLYVYVNRKPDAPMDTLTREFLKFVLSLEGQTIVVKDHYFPLPAEITGEVSTTLD